MWEMLAHESEVEVLEDLKSWGCGPPARNRRQTLPELTKHENVTLCLSDV